MYYKDSNFCSEEEVSEHSNMNATSVFCKERSPIEYYNWEKGLKDKEIRCRCTNQELLGYDFCDNCNSYI